jgi:hypothetical protein
MLLLHLHLIQPVQSRHLQKSTATNCQAPQQSEDGIPSGNSRTRPRRTRLPGRLFLLVLLLLAVAQEVDNFMITVASQNRPLQH